MKQVILNNGTEIPEIGFGTWQTTESVVNTVKTALDAGYRHITPQISMVTKQRSGRH